MAAYLIRHISLFDPYLLVDSQIAPTDRNGFSTLILLHMVEEVRRKGL